jgi:hypothetical protein
LRYVLLAFFRRYVLDLRPPVGQFLRHFSGRRTQQQ